MKLRIPIFGLALLSIAATGDPCDDTGSNGTTGITNVGANGSICSELGITCCVAVNDPCSDNNDCCSGNCSGSPKDDAGFGSDAGSTCAEPVANEGCSVALTSRCNTGQCACSSDTDCCLGNCLTSAIPGTSGHRCCLESGNPCDISADCCSLTCLADGQCE